MFSRYRRIDDKYKILLLYLILNNYDLSKIEKVIEVVQKKMFGIEYKKIYGITSEFVDVPKIEEELAAIRVPVVCSPLSYEAYSTAENIYAHRAMEKEKPLYINDMGVISPLMVITENCIVSSNMANPVEDADKKGFMYFADYVRSGICNIGDWEISYADKEFCIYYSSNNGANKELLYHAVELDQTATFKLVLYIIGKVADTIEEFPPDNFETETWRLEMKT